MSDLAALPYRPAAGIMLVDDSQALHYVGATDARSAALEAAQEESGEGPCVDSSLWGRPVLQPDLATTGPGRWPAFSAGALEAGIGAVFALPLRVGGIRLGVLDLYRDQPGELSSRELTVTSV